MKRLGQVLAIISSVCLLAGFIHYRIRAVQGTDELTRIKVMPSSKIGTAMEMYSTDWSGKYTSVPEPESTPNYLKSVPSPDPGWTPKSDGKFKVDPKWKDALMQSSKSGRVITPPSPTPDYEIIPMPSSKSATVFPKPSDKRDIEHLIER